MKVSEALYGAADAIERDGWTTGTSGMFVGGPHCALGAIAAATNSAVRATLPGVYDYLDAPGPGRDARDALLTHLLHDEGMPSVYTRDPRVYLWNDGQPSAAPVIETLRAAAVIEAAKETADERESVHA